MANRVRFVLKTFAVVRCLVTKQRFTKISNVAVSLFQGHTTAKDIFRNSVGVSKQKMRLLFAEVQQKSPKVRKKMKWLAITMVTLGVTVYEYNHHHTLVPITNRKHFTIIPRSMELQYQEMLINALKERYSIEDEETKTSLVLPDTDERVQFLKQILQQLLEACIYFSPECKEYMEKMQLLVVEDEEVNAFSTLGSILVVHTGTLEYLQQQENVNYMECIAGILAHELSHALSRHSIETMLYWTGFVYYIYITIIPDLILVPLIKGLMDRRMSRKREYEADYQALYLLKRAGFDPCSMINTLSILNDGYDEDDYPLLKKTKEIVSTHPRTENRIVNLQNRMQEFEKDFKEHYQTIQTSNENCGCFTLSQFFLSLI